MHETDDTGLDALLDLDGEVYRFDDGYWVKFECLRVVADVNSPHGISYSLTLHDRHNKRVVGFDNAHACPPPSRKKYAGRQVTWDHRHPDYKIRAVQYEFESPARLIEDFWAEVDRVMGRESR